MMHCKLKDTAEILEEIVHLCSEIQPCQEFSRRLPCMSLSYEICIPARNVLEDFAFGFYFATFKAEQLIGMQLYLRGKFREGSQACAVPVV